MRAHPIFPSFTTGEVTPLLYGRVDFAKYASGLRTLRNYLIRPQGPVFRRAGTHFVAEVKDSTKFTRMLRFEFSTDQAYTIEAGELYFRFYKDGGRIESAGTPVEVVTPYTSAQLRQLKYVQSADTMYFTHPAHPPYKLQRLSHTSWTMAAVNFLPPATFEGGVKPATTLTLSATTGTGITLTAGAASFLAGDVNRMVTVGTGRAIIRGFTSTTVVTADVVDAFASVGPHASQAWTINGTPTGTATPSIASPVHGVTTLTLSTDGFRSTDVGRYVRINKGVGRIIAVASATSATAEILSELINVTASPGGSWSIEDPSWSAARGYPRAIAFHEQRLVLAGTASEPQTFWGSVPGQYEVFALGPDDDDAYEFVIAANEVNTINWIVPTTKLLLGTASTEFAVTGSPGSSTAAIGPNSVDVKASTFWGSTPNVAPVRIGNAALFVTRTQTELREMIFALERDSYVANDMFILADHLTEDGQIVDAAYQRHPNSIVWCIRDDGTALALSYQRDHDVIGWARTVTGQDLPDDDELPEQGLFESVAVIPHWNGDRDVAWFTVQREIDGATKRFVEYMDDVEGYYKLLGVDSGLTYDGTADASLTLSALSGDAVTATAGSAIFTAGDVGSEIVAGLGKGRIVAFTSDTVVTINTTAPTCPDGAAFASLVTDAGEWGVARFSFSGLGHLSGETVTILGDGAVYPEAEVVAGEVTLQGLSVTRCEIGLPFWSKLVSMRPEVPVQGTSQGLQKHWSKIITRVHKTIGLFVNGEAKSFRRPSDAMDEAVPVFTGDIEHNNTKRDKDGIITIEQRDPLPQTIIAVFGTMGVGD